MNRPEVIGHSGGPAGADHRPAQLVRDQPRHLIARDPQPALGQTPDGTCRVEANGPIAASLVEAMVDHGQVTRGRNGTIQPPGELCRSLTILSLPAPGM